MTQLNWLALAVITTLLALLSLMGAKAWWCPPVMLGVLAVFLFGLAAGTPPGRRS